MDPQQAWNDMLDAYRARDPERVRDSTEALCGWLGKCGFPPDTGGGAALGNDWHRRLAGAGVAFMLEYVAVWEGDKS